MEVALSALVGLSLKVMELLSEGDVLVACLLEENFQVFDIILVLVFDEVWGVHRVRVEIGFGQVDCG